jgi:CRP-like cAMP-binding protein
MPQNDRRSTIRGLLQSSGTHFIASAYQAGAVLYAQGDRCDSVMHIESGRIRLAVTSTGGQEAICGLLGPGTFLGEEVLVSQGARRQTATAMMPTEVLVLAKAQMARLLHTQPAVADRFLAHILGRHAHLEADLADQLLNTSEQRLARILAELAGCDGTRPCRCEVPLMSQTLIAEMVGTSRSRVNVFLGKFKRLGLIEEAGGALQVTPSLLRAIDDGVLLARGARRLTGAGIVSSVP